MREAVLLYSKHHNIVELQKAYKSEVFEHDKSVLMLVRTYWPSTRWNMS